MTGRPRGGLGRGLGALIPSSVQPRPTDDGSHDNAPSATEDRGSTALAVHPDDGDTTAVDTDSGRPEDALSVVPGARFAEIPVEAIQANPKQPRSVFDEDSLAELTHSVREFGVLQPIVVRPLPTDDEPRYELVMGERRLRAATAAGLTNIPAIIRDTADEALLRDALLENIHRVQLNPLEEAAAYQQLLEEFDVTHDQLASRIGRSRSHVSNTIRLINLSVPVQRRVAAGVLSAGHARALLGLPSSNDQDELASRIVAEGMSVRAVEEVVALAVARGGLDRPGTPRSVPRRIVAPATHELAERLSDAFDTRVRVDIGKRKGRIVVEFATIDDLERIVGIIAPDVSRRADVAAASQPVESGERHDGESA